MNLNNRLAKAIRQIGMIDGAVRYVTDKGRIRAKQPEKWEKLVYKIYVKKGVLYVEKEGKQIQPEKKSSRGNQNTPNVPNVPNETTD